MSRKSDYAASGSRHPNAKLTDEQVIELRRRRWEDREELKNLATDYNISMASVHRIIAGQRYKNIPLHPQMPRYFRAHTSDGRRRELPEGWGVAQ